MYVLILIFILFFYYSCLFYYIMYDTLNNVPYLAVMLVVFYLDVVLLMHTSQCPEGLVVLILVYLR